MKILILLVTLLTLVVNIIIGAFVVGNYEEINKANLAIYKLNKDVVENNRKLLGLQSNIASANKEIDMLELSISNNKENIVRSTDGKLSKHAKDIRFIIAEQNEINNKELDAIKIFLDELRLQTKKGLDLHDSNFEKNKEILKEIDERLSDFSRYIRVRKKNGITIRELVDKESDK